jgi:hypothetical protein
MTTAPSETLNTAPLHGVLSLRIGGALFAVSDRNLEPAMNVRAATYVGLSENQFSGKRREELLARRSAICMRRETGAGERDRDMEQTAVGDQNQREVDRSGKSCPALRRALHAAIHGTLFGAVHGQNRGSIGRRNGLVFHVVAVMVVSMRMPGSGGLHGLTMALHRLHGLHVGRP